LHIKEEVVKRLRDGEPVRQVTGSYRSRSEVVEGVRVYLSELERKTEDTRARLDAAEKKRVVEGSEFRRLRFEKGTLEKEIAALKDNDRELQEKVDASIEKLEQVGSRLEQYKRQGFDEELFLKLSSIDGKKAEEVWIALKDEDAAQRLRDEVASGLKRLEVINEKIALAVGKECRTERNLSSLERKVSNKSSAVYLPRNFGSSGSRCCEWNERGGSARFVEAFVVWKEIVNSKAGNWFG
jgi:chromosome segregation ATPase